MRIATLHAVTRSINPDAIFDQVGTIFADSVLVDAQSQGLSKEARVEQKEVAAKRVESVLNILSGKWKVLILWHLGVSGTCRFGELRRKLPGVTQRTLTRQLRELETAGMIQRKVYAEVPPKTEYSLTEASKDLRAVYMELCAWGDRHEDLLCK